MAYTAWSVVFGEQPTAAKWNQLGANDAGFKDGTNIDDNAIITRHLLAGNVTSVKLAEAFFRGRKKVINTSSAPTGLLVQHGWDYMQGNGAASMMKAITFPVAFAEPPIVLCNQLAARSTASGAPDSTDDFTTGFSNAAAAYPDDITTTGFNHSLTATSTFSNTFYFGMSWIAIGVPS